MENLFHSLTQKFKSADPAWLYQQREKAIIQFTSRGFPTKREEAWRQISVAPLLKISFRSPAETSPPLSATDLAPYFLDAAKNSTLVFVDGHWNSELSSISGLPDNVVVENIQTALSKQEVLKSFLTAHRSLENPFAILNQAFFAEGVFCRIPKGTRVKTPIHFLFVSTKNAKDYFVNPYNFILAETGSEATLIESYVGLDENVYWTNGVTELVLEENAGIDHYKLQLESEAAFNFSSLITHQKRSSRLSSHSTILGGALSRYDIQTKLEGEGADCTLNGFFMGHKNQQMDHHVRVDHLTPHGTSNQLFKGILDDKAKGIFNGLVVVHEGAKKTEAHQNIRNLLLSEFAEADPEPQLEIHNDDVKCTHGAAVGQLDKNALFYLQSRGISAEGAKSLLTYAFASEVIQKIKVPDIRHRLMETVLQRLPESTILKELQ